MVPVFKMSGCWIEVTLHPEGPTTGQLDHGLPWILLSSRANAKFVNKFHVALHASNVAFPTFDQTSL
jgi:hypothetical protein